MKYQIENTISGLVLGVYEASSSGEALELMAREAGYESYQAAQEVVPAAPGEILVTELDEDESSIEVSLNPAGEAKVLAWLAEVAKPGVNKDAVILDVDLHLWGFYPEVPAYELGAQYTRSGRPEILHLADGEDYKVEVI